MEKAQQPKKLMIVNILDILRKYSDIDYSGLFGKTVLYSIFPDNKTGEDRAEILSVFSVTKVNGGHYCDNS